jgi:UDP-N-acetylmuramyl pentapeptide phosphotransferase/UDP-N-acetylglucosamine-1-phosphate transferase
MFIALFAIPSIIQVAHKKQLLDMPNQRRLHTSLTPRLGGLAIFAGFFSAVLTFGDMNASTQKLLAGSIIIFFIGLKDDMVSISAFKKFFVQFLAASIVLFMGDIRIVDFYGILGIGRLDDGISYFLTFIVILGITNAINLIDGVDGLAGSLISLALLVYALIGAVLGGSEGASLVYISVGLLGALIGFLKYNFKEAIIFMGDTGSLVSGFIVAYVSISVSNLPVGYNLNGVLPIIAVTAIIMPISDTVRVFMIRLFKGDSPFTADRNHFHHRLISLGLTPIMVVVVEVLMTVLALIIVFVGMMFTTPTISFMILLLVLITVYFLVERKYNLNVHASVN